MNKEEARVMQANVQPYYSQRGSDRHLKPVLPTEVHIRTYPPPVLFEVVYMT